MSKIITSLALLSIGIVGYAQDTPPTGRVGINTTTPKGTLEIAAPRNDSKGLLDTKNNGVVIPTLTKKEVASLTKPVDGTLVFITDEEENVTTTNQISDISNVSGNGFYYYVATGENKGTWASSGSTYVRNKNKDVSFDADASIVKPLSKVNIIKYAARAWGDWIADLNTNIDATKYDMAILSAVLLGAEMNFAEEPIPGVREQVPEVSGFKSGNTWHIKGDFKGYSTKDGRNGTWIFYVMVTPKGTINYYEATTSVAPSNNHNIALPEKFVEKEKK